MEKIAKSFDKELDLSVFTLGEDTEYPDIRTAIDKYFQGTITKFNIWDYTKLKKHLTTDEIKALGEQVSSLSDPQKERFDLIVVPNPLQFGLARMYSSFTEASKKKSGAFSTLVFRTYNEALAWVHQVGRK